MHIHEISPPSVSFESSDAVPETERRVESLLLGLANERLALWAPVAQSTTLHLSKAHPDRLLA